MEPSARASINPVVPQKEGSRFAGFIAMQGESEAGVLSQRMSASEASPQVSQGRRSICTRRYWRSAALGCPALAGANTSQCPLILAVPQGRDCVVVGPRLLAGGTLKLIPEVLEENPDCSFDKFSLGPDVKGFELQHHL